MLDANNISSWFYFGEYRIKVTPNVKIPKNFTHKFYGSSSNFTAIFWVLGDMSTQVG